MRPLLILACLGAAAAASSATAGSSSSSVVTCGLHRGFTVYANGATCPTAKKMVRRVEELPYRAAKCVRRTTNKAGTCDVVIRSIAGYLCVATYQRTTAKMKAGSCLKLGTVATGFGWTRDGTTVPLPPGVTAGTATG